MPTCWIISGRNGAGKTTFALNYLPSVAKCSRFVNADLIAAGLSPLAPEQEIVSASRIFLNEIEQNIATSTNFAFETTLSGRGYLRLIHRLRAKKWQVELIYLALPNLETSRQRVAERVAHGGHNIPSEAIERRFSRSLSNLFSDFSAAANNCRCFLNDGPSPQLVFEQQGDLRYIVNQALYQHLLEEAKR